jgi:hypothetical protein
MITNMSELKPKIKKKNHNASTLYTQNQKLHWGTPSLLKQINDI